jgi:taurine transport system substrate-binding protein
VEIVNLQPPAIIAAWQRGDIDGAYVWAPAVNALEKDGKVLTDSSQVGEWAHTDARRVGGTQRFCREAS